MTDGSVPCVSNAILQHFIIMQAFFLGGGGGGGGGGRGQWYKHWEMISPKFEIVGTHGYLLITQFYLHGQRECISNNWKPFVLTQRVIKHAYSQSYMAPLSLPLPHN